MTNHDISFITPPTSSRRVFIHRAGLGAIAVGSLPAFNDVATLDRRHFTVVQPKAGPFTLVP